MAAQRGSATSGSGLRLSSVTMSRFPLRAAGNPPSAALALALAVAVLGLVAAGCGKSDGHRAAIATASTPRNSKPCKLDKAQRHTVALALADIRRLRLIQAPMHTFSQHGAPAQEALTGKFLLDLGAVDLPTNVFADLIHRAKAAVSLCGDCSNGLETEEPFFGNRGKKRCG